MIRYILIAILITFAGGAYFVLRAPDTSDFAIDPAIVGEEAQERADIQPSDSLDESKRAEVSESKEVSSGSLRKQDVILFDVPFTPQAPFANWDDIVYQQGCEEASVLMTMMWAQGRRGLSPQDANDSIQLLSTFEQKNYGEFRDASMADTARLVMDYFDYQDVEVISNVNKRDIISQLEKGNLVIAAVNGQLFGNPFFNPPGPVQHMVVIRGYDPNTKEFITNDPGTRHGNGYRYHEEILEGALQDYISGYKEPIREIHKRMIVIKSK